MWDSFKNLMLLFYLHIEQYSSQNWVPLYQPTTVWSSLAVPYSWLHFFPLNQLFPSMWELCPSSTINSLQWVFPTPLLSPPSTMFVSINNQTDGNLWYFSWIESAMSGKVGLAHSLWWIGEFSLMHFCSFYVFHGKCRIFSITVLVKPMSDPLHQLRPQWNVLTEQQHSVLLWLRENLESTTISTS